MWLLGLLLVAELTVNTYPVTTTVVDQPRLLRVDGQNPGEALTFNEGKDFGKPKNRVQGSGAIIQILTDGKFISVKAKKTLFESGTLTKLSDRDWLLTGTEGRYLVEVTVFEPGLQEYVGEVNLGIQPVPPSPEPNPPGPSPSPIPEIGFRVLFVYESEFLPLLPPSQRLVLTSKDVRDYLASHCVKGPDGKTPEVRFFDQHTNVNHESQIWQKAMLRPRTGLPWLIIGTGTSGYEGPVPPTIQDTLNLLKKYGGP